MREDNKGGQGDLPSQLQNYLAQRTPGTHCLTIDSLCRVYLRKYMI
jgi:hypothetical protein